ncbi:MAG TPA: hypothetical protein K8V93_03855 [Corynebacterium pollutisoli]|uniref:DUF4439 domain-containing protein n=1 Tax=Corynebacterium pollutisoli TaxID=1610489 RepID=A0A7X8RF57_9CORY|nr:hypothetical protein [Corynebacterium pollutisoli]HJD78129.1 hypothetical protein [Corynebacterium pollutisoli]
MNRRLLPFVLVPLLASCSVEMLGPRPNPELSTLADQAHATGRAADAAELEAEIARLCGTHEDGTVPTSCDYAPTPVEEADAFEVTVAAVDDVPAESRDLVARQAVALAAGEAAPVPLSEAAAEQARALLRTEYAHVYGLQVAQAFHGDVETLIDAAETRITALREVLAPAGDVPVAEPGYAVSGELSPGDEGFVTALVAERDAAWLNAVSDADDDGWRAWLARVA